MAKSLRSSRNKSNKSKLRTHVFGPAEDARKERLSAKLLELATNSKSEDSGNWDRGQQIDIEGTVDIEGKNVQNSMHETIGREAKHSQVEEVMDIDHATGSSPITKSVSGGTRRIQKKGRGKAAASMVFPVYKKRRRIGPVLSRRQRKQSLKP